MNRRKILGGMIAAPFAGKKMATALGSPGSLLGGTSLASTDWAMTPSYPVPSEGIYDSAVRVAKEAMPSWKLFRQHGIPAWMREEFDYNFDDRRIGHDVAALRSVSEAGKRMIERERAWRRHVEQTLNPGWSELQEIRQAWYRKLGF